MAKVIMRADFDPLPQLQSTAAPEFSNHINHIYPIAKGTPTAEISVSVGPDGTGVQQQITGMQWEYRKAEDGTRVVFLSKSHLSIEFDKGDYRHFPDLRADADTIFRVFADLYGQIPINRLALRYVNQITGDGDPFDWDGLISQHLLQAVFSGVEAKNTLVRSMHQLTTLENDIRTILNYGFFNPDFPNLIAQKQFVVDIDCHRPGVTTMAEVIGVLDQLNTICEALFEKSIDVTLRKTMGVING